MNPEPPIKLRCVRVKPLNFSNKKIDRFEVIEAPDYVKFHVFNRRTEIKDWSTILELLNGGHSVNIENALEKIPWMEYQARGMNAIQQEEEA